MKALPTTAGLRSFPSLAYLPGVRHAFADAKSFGAFEARSRVDMEKLVSALATDADGVRTVQKHTAVVRAVDRTTLTSEAFDAGVDGLVTVERGLALIAIGADCPTLFLASEDAKVAAIVHCGWRGVAGGILDEALRVISETSGHRPEQLVAAVGPGARGCCYEVGEEVIGGLLDAGLLEEVIRRPHVRSDGSASRAVDLAAGIEAHLVGRGVDSGRIHLARECTICGGERFLSHRRSGSLAGRMAGAILLEAGS